MTWGILQPSCPPFFYFGKTVTYNHPDHTLAHCFHHKLHTTSIVEMLTEKKRRVGGNIWSKWLSFEFILGLDEQKSSLFAWFQKTCFSHFPSYEENIKNMQENIFFEIMQKVVHFPRPNPKINSKVITFD